MKYTFETDDKEEAQDAMNGTTWRAVVWDFDQYLRSEYKHNQNEAAYEIREKLREMINDYNLSIE